MSLELCLQIELPARPDARGNLAFVEGNRHVPFEIERVYYLYDVPPDAERGQHAHRELQQLIIAIAGSFDIELDDGFRRKSYHLDRADRGLYVCPMIWREMKNFSAGAVALVLASKRYDEADYYRDYGQFLLAVKESGKR